jgi:hypothetical protein
MLIFDKNLSMAAQNFAAYLLKIGKLTEEGPKRETVQTRAIDVGYGGGAPFSVSQNVAMIWVDKHQNINSFNLEILIEKVSKKIIGYEGTAYRNWCCR